MLLTYETILLMPYTWLLEEGNILIFNVFSMNIITLPASIILSSILLQ
jgi:hypothetical protein